MTKNTVSHENLVKFGLRLKTIRATRGISQRWLARESGLTSVGLCFIECGKSCPTVVSLERLADVLGVTMDELWRGTKSNIDKEKDTYDN